MASDSPGTSKAVMVRCTQASRIGRSRLRRVGRDDQQ